MKKAAFTLIAFTVLAKVLGFIRDIILSHFYGASNVSDAYLIAITIPTVVFAFIGTGIVTGYIPIYSKIENRMNTKVADTFTSNLINWILILCVLLTLVVMFFTVPVVKLFASGFEGATLKMAVDFTKISIFGIFFSGVIYVFSGYLQLKNSFIISVAMGIPLNIIIIISIAISAKAGNTIFLVAGTVIAMGIEMLFLIPFVLNKGFRYNFKIDLGDKHLKSLLYLSVPVIIGVSVNQINVLVDRTIASQLGMGGISAITYANRLVLFFQGSVVISLVTIMYPAISKIYAENNMDGFKKILIETIGVVNLLIIPATIGSTVFAAPIVSMLFGHGAFDTQANILTSSAFFFFSIGMIGFGLREVLSRAFYAMQDTKTPMINAAIGVGLNILLNIILSKIMGIGGLALATSVSAIFTTALMFISLKRKIGGFQIKQMTISFLKILVISLIMGILSKLSFNYLTISLSQHLSLILSVGIGVVSYLIMINLIKVDEVNMINRLIRKKLGNKS